MRPIDWSPEDRECAKHMAHIGAKAALDEIQLRVSSAIFSKLLHMFLGWLIIEGAIRIASIYKG